MLLDLEKPYLLQEFIKTHQAMSVHKKKGWLHLPAVSRGLADSQHSLCATTPSPEGTWPVLSHLSVRATRAHPTLKEFIAGSHIHLKTCICGPLRAAVWGPYNLDNSVWSRTLYTAYQHLIQLVTASIPQSVPSYLPVLAQLRHTTGHQIHCEASDILPTQG